MSVGARAQTEAGIGMLEVTRHGGNRIVTEDQWAADLIEVLDLGDVLPSDHSPEDRYSLLCAEGAEMTTDAGGRRVPARSAFRVGRDVEAPSPGKPLRVVLDVPATALYQLAVEGKGLQRWTVDQSAVGNVEVTRLGVAVAPKLVPLSEGPHELTAYIGRRGSVSRVELAAYRPLCIAPASGWRTGRPLTYGAKARTMVRALGLERRLPEVGEGQRLEGEDFVSATNWGGRTNEAEGASDAAFAKAGQASAEFRYRFRLDEPGVVSVTARLHGDAGQLWSIDGRHQAWVDPTHDGEAFRWAHVVTTNLAVGDHVIRALVPPEAGIDLIRVVRRQASDADYVEVLEQMGFREGPTGSRVSASAASRNLSEPLVAELASDFLGRQTGGSIDAPLVAIEMELDTLYSRPLSPVLPADL